MASCVNRIVQKNDTAFYHRLGEIQFEKIYGFIGGLDLVQRLLNQDNIIKYNHNERKAICYELMISIRGVLKLELHSLGKDLVHDGEEWNGHPIVEVLRITLLRDKTY